VIDEDGPRRQRVALSNGRLRRLPNERWGEQDSTVLSPARLDSHHRLLALLARGKSDNVHRVARLGPVYGPLPEIVVTLTGSYDETTPFSGPAPAWFIAF
jgi:hypothetical protein